MHLSGVLGILLYLLSSLGDVGSPYRQHNWFLVGKSRTGFLRLGIALVDSGSGPPILTLPPNPVPLVFFLTITLLFDSTKMFLFAICLHLL